MEPCRECGDGNGIKWEPKDDQRPEMMGEIVANYEHETSMYPESIRASFKNGKTIIYDRRVEQPAPVFEENIRIIRKWKQGYVNQPGPRRRRRK